MKIVYLVGKDQSVNQLNVVGGVQCCVALWRSSESSLRRDFPLDCERGLFLARFLQIR